MKALTRTVLFCRVQVEKQMHLYPVAVFPDAERAKSYAAFLHIAHRSGDHKTAVQLDSKARVKEDGTLWPGAKFSVTEVPYDPAPTIGLDDEFTSEPAHT